MEFGDAETQCDFWATVGSETWQEECIDVLLSKNIIVKYVENMCFNIFFFLIKDWIFVFEAPLR